MGCIYSDFEGRCNLYEEEDDNVDDSDMGHDKAGFCMSEDDENPSDNCYSFESVENEEDDE